MTALTETIGVMDDRGHVSVVPYSTLDQSTQDKIQRAIKRAKDNDITLVVGEFVIMDGDPTLDGMTAREWLDAQLMD